MQNQATSRGITHLAVSGQIAPLTQQIPKAALAAMQGQKEGFAELRDARDSFGNLLERLVEGGEVRGLKVSATSAQTRPVLDALRDAWSKQADIINLILAQENRFLASRQPGQGSPAARAGDDRSGRCRPEASAS
jgi:hypothetical protein